MACTLSNKCAKNLSKRTVLLQLIIKNVVTCFFEHSVEWLGYRMVKKRWRYVKPFSSDTGTLRTDRQTDGQICYINIARQYADARQKSRFSMNIWLLDRWLLCDRQLRRPTIQFTAQTTTHQWILFIAASMDDLYEEKRTEQNLIVRSGESEAEVTNSFYGFRFWLS